jgi:hypothetical protein
MGAGFKNWRPVQLVGARRVSGGLLIGGHVALAQNSQIADFALTLPLPAHSEHLAAVAVHDAHSNGATFLER